MFAWQQKDHRKPKSQVHKKRVLMEMRPENGGKGHQIPSWGIEWDFVGSSSIFLYF